MSLFSIAKQRLTTSISSIKWLAWLLLISCSAPKTEQQPTDTSLKYAKTFEIEGQTIRVKPLAAAPDKVYQLPENPQRIICTSTTHLHNLELLGLEEKLIGFANTNYIYSELFRSRAQQGLLSDVGSEQSMNLELIIGLQPDLVIAFDLTGTSDILQRIENAGIPVILNTDFLESTALGKAEWIKFFGALFDRRQMAYSIFNEIERQYLSLRQLAAEATEEPVVLSGNVYGDTWFMPGGQNNFAQYFQDAGARYAYAQDSSSSWLELSFESVFHESRDADYWIGMGSFSSLDEIRAQDARYEDFQAFQKGQVFNYNRRQIPNGGNDFFESAYSRPDLVLADLIYILHPELLPDHELYYYRKLE